jgi:hypothetical protein
MLQVTPQHRLLLAIEPIDLRANNVLAATHLVGRYLHSPTVHVPQSNYWCMMPADFGCARSDFRQENSHGGQRVILKR